MRKGYKHRSLEAKEINLKKQRAPNTLYQRRNMRAAEVNSAVGERPVKVWQWRLYEVTVWRPFPLFLSVSLSLSVTPALIQTGAPDRVLGDLSKTVILSAEQSCNSKATIWVYVSWKELNIWSFSFQTLSVSLKEPTCSCSFFPLVDFFTMRHFFDLDLSGKYDSYCLIRCFYSRNKEQKHTQISVFAALTFEELQHLQATVLKTTMQTQIWQQLDTS